VIFGRSWPFIVFLVILILMLVLHFIPDIKAARVKAGSRERLFDELLRAEKTKKGKARRKG